MRVCIFILFVFSWCSISAQHRVTFRIKSFPAYHEQTHAVYAAGSFNNWDPGDQQFRLVDNELSITLPTGSYEYKFTRGSWSTVESGPSGISVNNRRLDVLSDTVIQVEIPHWADHFPPPLKLHTASKNVQVIDT